MTDFDKTLELMDEIMKCKDDFVHRFMKLEGGDLDKKLAVVRALNDGKTPDDIPDYYDVLDMPEEDEIWD